MTSVTLSSAPPPPMLPLSFMFSVKLFWQRVWRDLPHVVLPLHGEVNLIDLASGDGLGGNEQADP